MSNAKKGYLKFGLIIIAFITILFCKKNLYDIVSVSGNSMSDTVSNNGICFVKIGNEDILQYDIVLAKNNYQTIIKRVIACPYDCVEIKDGVVYVNEMPIEKYNFYTEMAGIAEEKIYLKEGEYFLLGDNREISVDSRNFGVVNQTNIIGVVETILWKGKK